MEGAMRRLRSELERHFRGELRENEPLAQRTSVRAGGAADLLARPVDVEDLRMLLAAAAAAQIPLSLMGGGANSIVADDGIEGVVVRLPVFAEEVALDEEGGSFTLGAGAPIARIPQLMRTHALVGGEFMAGIPGTLGGATSMNAGTKNGEIVRIMEAVELVTAEGARWHPAGELRWRYRACELPQGAAISRIRIRLRRADEAGLAASREAMLQDLGYRKRTQPLKLPNSGSVFTNPPGDHAGRLIEACGLKGRREGGAQISELHANWIVNHGEAKASEVSALIELARGEVEARFGVRMTPEVKRIGRWPDRELW